MAPRETIAPSTNRSMVEGGATNQAQRDALLKGEPPPYKPPTVDWKLKDVPMGESTSTFSESESKAQVVALTKASEDGTPFCEECAKAEAEAPEAEASDSPGGDDWEDD